MYVSIALRKGRPAAILRIPVQRQLRNIAVNGTAAYPPPTITITGIPLGDFNSEPGIPSAEQSYTVSGSNLKDNITITPPADFEISPTSGSGWRLPPTLTQSGGNVAETDIYVRFNRATEGTSFGNIAHTSREQLNRMWQWVVRRLSLPRYYYSGWPGFQRSRRCRQHQRQPYNRNRSKPADAGGRVCE